jgi:hypothetical protein
VGGAALFGCLLAAFLWTRSSSSGGGAFGGELGRLDEASGVRFSLRQFLSYVWQFYLPRFGFMDPMLGPPYGYRQMYIDSFFGGYATLEVNFRSAAYDRLQILAFLGFVGLYTTVVLRWRRLRRHWPSLLFLLGTLVSLLALLHISAYRDLQPGGDPLITGRYLLPCVAIFALTIAGVIGSLPRRVAPWAGALVLAGFVLLGIEGFVINAARFYA